ncbi:MAG: amino acid ABC transporter permease [Gammaproteobacteria bacterium]
MNAHAKALPFSGKSSIWNDPAFRAVLFQLLLLVGVIGFGWYIFDNTVTNLKKSGIASGFGFLNTTAGFGIVSHLIDYSEESTYGRAFLVGLLNTLLVAGFGIVFATALGIVIGIARLSSNWLVAKLAAVYIEIIRNIPLLLQIFFWYFGVLRSLPNPRQSIEIGGLAFLNLRGLYLPKPIFEPGFGLVLLALALAVVAVIVLAYWAHRRRERTGQPFPTLYAALGILLGLLLLAAAVSGFPLSWSYPELKGFNFQGGMVIIPEFTALLVALSVYTAAFIAEIVRAGIQAVSHGQSEAAAALGLRRGTALRLVVLPQALRVIVPPLTSQYLNITKNSSLAAAVAYPELVSVFAGTVLNQTGQAVEIIAITMAVYLSISLLISLLMNWYNRKIALVER